MYVSAGRAEEVAVSFLLKKCVQEASHTLFVCEIWKCHTACHMKRLVVRNRPVTLEEKLNVSNSIFRTSLKQLVVGPLSFDFGI